MAIQFIKKKFRKNLAVKTKPVQKANEEVDTIKAEVDKISKNKREKKKEMINKEQISAIENIANSMDNEVKIVKKDKGLIERTESSKIILTEDNRQVLND